MGKSGGGDTKTALAVEANRKAIVIDGLNLTGRIEV